ncbi:nuclear transport factor 2 family protein [Cloacibacillus sp. An23]|uniref:nuclear transport factor 2 family protein n=1 Tax=Cloacibacillus sp. An23 TaxID=1965591 RepID=UPI000B368E71|nr:nuclear transport factor 2 family protein [Cloacibacillus sp. An23]OUO93740.1 hypothetical protein B5F39_06045 [Cloacibacillus sp. An23]
MARCAEPSDYEAVKAVLEIYCKEGAAANVPAVKKAFHEKAVMNGCHAGHGEYVLGPIGALYDLYDEVGAAEGCETHIDVLDIAGDIAVGRVIIKNWHGKDFADYHELMKIDGEWKIVAKIYCEL